MTILQLFIFALSSLALLILHSYFRRGLRLTLNFFLFALIAGIRKESGTFLAPPQANTQYPTPFMHTAGYPLVFSILNTTIGWMLAFYLSWCIAEKIVGRSERLRAKIFPTLLFSGLVIAALAYAIEATAINVGWWRWVFFDERFSVLFSGGVHFFAINAWVYFAIPFLAAYFLIECSQFRNSHWKCIFFLIPFLRTCIMLFLGSHYPAKVYECIFFVFLICLAILNPLKFKYPEVNINTRINALLKGLIGTIPYLVSFVILSFLFFVDILHLKNYSILISLAPLVSILMLSLGEIPLWTILLFSASALIIFGKLGILTFVPILVFMILSGVNYFLSFYHNWRMQGKVYV